MFPDPAEVFISNVDEHAAFLFPIFSIDLSIIDASWSGQVHMVLSNYDPYNEATVGTFTEYCKDNSLGFDITDGRYRFQTDLAFFNLTADWVKWFEKTRTQFAITREHFRKTGSLPEQEETGAPFIDQLGGEPEWVQGDQTPLDPAGERMTFIAKVESWNYADDMCGRVLFLFYSHKHKIAVIVDQCD